MKKEVGNDIALPSWKAECLAWQDEATTRVT